MNYYDPEKDRSNRAYDRVMRWVTFITFALILWICYALLESFHLIPHGK